MSDPRLRLHAPRAATRVDTPRRPIGRYLVDAGILDAHSLIRCLQLQTRMDAPLGEIVVAEGLASEAQVLEAVAQQHGMHVIDLGDDPPDETLRALMPAEFWLRHRVVPWMMLGDTLVLATARPDLLDRVRTEMPRPDRPVLAVVAPDAQVMTCLSQSHSAYLADRAENRVAPRFSCRGWQPVGRRYLAWTLAALVGAVVVTALAPDTLIWVICMAAILSLWLIAGLKIAAFVTRMLSNLHSPPAPAAHFPPQRLPRISVMVPLFHETEIAGALVRRLARLSYPKALLEVVLVLEERDTVTKATLAATDLPNWMKVIEVPDNGSVTTKPRALNYALDFCRGDIIGIWDAEDAPGVDQLDEVAARFAAAPPEVVCLQGVLDYYNPRTNWLSRCFTIEYATHWRVLLPGIARMGMVIPLGGTTLFFRRAALEELGGWDAHNVTEDADLGVRLARCGYRTELIPTVTHEEANCRVWPWIKQRSRWLKGFMVTYLVHMRHPRQLLRDLGWWRFLGVQAFFLGTLSQFLFAPVLWSFWVIPFGVPHPVLTIAGPGTVAMLCALFVAIELCNITIGCVAVSGPKHRFLTVWVPTLVLYFPLGAIAAYKALLELVFRPFYWDKTEHGLAAPDCPEP